MGRNIISEVARVWLVRITRGYGLTPPEIPESGELRVTIPDGTWILHSSPRRIGDLDQKRQTD